MILVSDRPFKRLRTEGSAKAQPQHREPQKTVWFHSESIHDLVPVSAPLKNISQFKMMKFPIDGGVPGMEVSPNGWFLMENPSISG